MLWVTFSLVISVSGPFGSDTQFNLLQRMVFWAPVLAVVVLISIVSRVFVQSRFGNLRIRHVAVLSAILVCVLVCPLLFLLIPAVFPVNLTRPMFFGELCMLVGSIGLGVCALRSTVAATPVEIAPMPVSRLLQRLEPEMRGPLLAISVRDHYVDVLTEQGPASLLMRFGDAITEAGVDGAQVHRSHWVAWEAVEAVEREGNKLFLRLKSGGLVPVSKNHREKLVARGLI